MVKPFIRQHILLSGRRHNCHVPAASDPSQRIDRIKEKGVFDVKKTLAMVLALVMMFTLLTGCGGGGGDSGGDGTGAEYTWRMALNGSAPGELGYG